MWPVWDTYGACLLLAASEMGKTCPVGVVHVIVTSNGAGVCHRGWGGQSDACLGAVELEGLARQTGAGVHWMGRGVCLGISGTLRRGWGHADRVGHG